MAACSFGACLSLSVTYYLNFAAPVCVRHFVGVTFLELCSSVAFHVDLSFGCFASQFRRRIFAGSLLRIAAVVLLVLCTLPAFVFSRDHFVLLLFTVLWACAFAHFHLTFHGFFQSLHWILACFHLTSFLCYVCLVLVPACMQFPSWCTTARRALRRCPSLFAVAGLFFFPSELLHSRLSRLGLAHSLVSAGGSFGAGISDCVCRRFYAPRGRTTRCSRRLLRGRLNWTSS